MGPAYFGIATRRLTWDVLTLHNPRVGIGWGRVSGCAEQRFINIWLATLWFRLELRDA